MLASLGLGANWTWGLSIIGLTIIVRLVLFPLTWKQFKSAQRMQAIQPKLKELQKKYKGDRGKLQEETMKLYQEHRVNPFASCLPLAATAAGVHRPVRRHQGLGAAQAPEYQASVEALSRHLPVDPAPRAAGPFLHPARRLRGLAADLDRADAARRRPTRPQK